MSSAVGFIPTVGSPLAPLAPPGMSLGSAAAAGGIAVLVCYASYLAIRKLHQDYRCSLATFNARAEATAEGRAAAAAAAKAMSAAAAAVVGQTDVRAAQHAQRTFMAQQVKRMMATVEEFATPDADLRGRLLALQTMHDGGDADPDEVLTAYRAAAEAFATVAAKAGKSPAARKALLEEVQALREEVMASALAGDRHAALRAQLLGHIDGLAALAANQPSLAGQGVANLRRRLHRHLRELHEGEARKMKLADEIRALVGETLARLQAVAGVERLPAQQSQSTVLLARLNDLLVADPVDVEALRALAREGEALFAACDGALEEQVVAEYVGNQVTEVLLAMGYKAAQVAPEGEAGRTVMAPVDDRFGLQVQVDGQGRLQTQMVALDAEAADQGKDGEAHICDLVEQVMHALRARDIAVSERFRAHLADGERLEVVEMPGRQSSVVTQAEAAMPKQMRADTP